MAKLIPSFMDDRTPPGERDVFSLLTSAPVDWVALHSLDLAPWNRGLRTEIDFVVIVPDAGILCVEVKSHADICFDGHRWYPASIKRSPFKQAVDGSSTFHRRLAALDTAYQHVPVAHCCIFPNARFDLAPNLSVQPWELMDMQVFRRFSRGEEFCADLKLRLQRSIQADRNLSTLSVPLKQQDVERIVSLCVPVQRRRPDARQEIEWREAEVEAKLREQQRPVLKLTALNRRVVVNGGAGTGKTLIAMEVARRAAETGRRVALVCFNQLIGDWIHKRMSELQPALPQLVSGRAIRVLADMTGISIPADPPQRFWDIELPRRIEERLTDPDFRAVAEFDCLIVDEAQDILARHWVWDCLRQLMNGGTDGSVVLFGDFDNQVLANRDALERAHVEFKREFHPTFWTLSENCRNYRIVGETAVRLAGIGTDVYSGFMRGSGGMSNYDIFFYDDDHVQLDRIGHWIREFKSKGFRNQEITLLSFVPDQRSAAACLKLAGYKLQPARIGGDVITFASVQAFKGMENKAVILTDVVLRDSDFDRSLFYTGMTRATECVRIACQKESEDILLRWLQGES